MMFKAGQKVKLPYLTGNFSFVGRVGVVIFSNSRFVVVHNGLYPESFWNEEVAPYQGEEPVGARVLYARNVNDTEQISSVCVHTFSNREGARA